MGHFSPHHMGHWVNHIGKWMIRFILCQFGKMNIICQYFTQLNSRFTKEAKCCKCKFTNIFFAKTLKRLIPKAIATLLEFCTIQSIYIYIYIYIYILMLIGLEINITFILPLNFYFSL